MKNYAKQILIGLNYLHSKNIIHQDLKAKNILLTENDTLKLADFGLSRKLKSSYSTSRQFDSFKGTCTHVAPEIINSAKYGRKIDIW